ncbi:MAG: alpha/beta fold hydrolase [Alphaproteobacteria bacterium]|nr:alpha/beta fold hydrolase [Alphaproteobacteria bacterium]MBU1515897.1 alpha/beta fold hydrolase [Alphaproteobacteria bacterium]MBU2094119.1 alpha/beta fold hydrolase [Alphaproteobacteria bacterium]MBU2151471.1 alpha/beta fold hydrolase [Alphaproteobacteria bacterium]MBU2305253.1 alpha/beta fold hydrolase [Alphaproteobacteria bacterium]
MIRAVLPAALGASLILLGGAARAGEPPLNDSARNIRDMREIALSPDGAQVAAVITASTAEGGQPHVWLLSTDGKTARQVTVSRSDKEPGERTIAWAKDGTALFFLAKRGEANGLYRLPTTGGEAQALTLARPAAGAVVAGWGLTAEDAVAAGVQSYEIAPGDRRIAVIAGDGVTAAREAQVKRKDDAVRVGHDDAEKVRLYIVDPVTGAAAEVAVPDNVQGARWNAAGDELLVGTAPADEDLAPASRLWRVKVDGAATELKGVAPTVRRASWTADGAVYQGQCEDDAPPGCIDLFSYDFRTQASRGLTRGLKGSLESNYLVERGGKAVITSIQVSVAQRPARIDLTTGAIRWLDAGQPVVGLIDTNTRETGWAMLAGGPTQPTAAFYAPKLGGPLTKLGGPALVPAEWPATPSQLVSWTNGDLTVEGLLYLPKVAAGARIPLVVNVHGGPTGVFQDRYSPLVNLLVAQGWAVFQPNPRGSTGRGAAFSAANKNDLGGGDYTDIMTGVDALLAKYPLDPDRMALIGYSYGGEMAGFVAGRTDRFKALVAGAPVIDQFSEYGTEDGSYYDRWFYGKPWDNFADAWRQSPLSRVGHAKTPLLLLQGEEDPVDPLGQSQEMHRAMMQVGAPVVLVTYPRETHATLGAAFAARPTREPWHGVDLRRRMIQFIADAFAGKNPAALP